MTRSRVELLWQQLHNLTQDADTHPAIKNAMQAAEQKYFKDFLTLSDEMRKVGEAGGKYPMTPAQWVETTSPQIGSLLDVLYAARTAGEAAADAAISQALGEITLALGLIALTIAIGIGCAWVVIARVSSPLTRLSGAMLEPRARPRSRPIRTGRSSETARRQLLVHPCRPADWYQSRISSPFQCSTPSNRAAYS